jgi:hypothetical protein
VVPLPSPLPLHEWASFYAIIGSAAAALTGLQFVVVALSATRQKLTVAGAAEALGSFGTPTIMHFCAALLIAALMTTPRQTAGSLGGCLIGAGGAGLVYAIVVAARAARQKAYVPVLEDWIWHVVLPLLSYLSLLIAAIVMRHAPAESLYGVGASELLFLFIGIHNAWDSAVWIATGAEPPAPPPSPPSTPSGEDSA